MGAGKRMGQSAALAAVALGGVLQAELVAVRFTDATAAARYRTRTVELDGEPVLVGEPVRALDPRHLEGEWPAYADLELWVIDREDPRRPAYRWRDGERSELRPSLRLELPGERIGRVIRLCPDTTAAGLATELELRDRRRNELERARRRSSEPGSRERVLADLRLATELERLRAWSERRALVAEVQDLDEDLAELYEELGDEPLARGGPAVFARVREVATPAPLVELAGQLSAGEDVFRVLESTHVRLVHDQRVPRAEALRALEVAELAVEGFRRWFVYPYLERGIVDRIPDRLLCELWFGPDERERFEAYFERYYGLDWGEGDEREYRLGLRSKYEVRESVPELLSYTKYRPGLPVADLVVHVVGHRLAAAQLGRTLGPFDEAERVPLAWLKEALGFHLALEYRGRNETSCTGFLKSSHTEEREPPPRREVETPRQYLLRLARESHRGILSLATARYGELDRSGALAAWSLLEYLLGQGEQGLRFLDRAGAAGLDPATFQERLRAAAGELFEGTAGDPLARIEASWRAELASD